MTLATAGATAMKSLGAISSQIAIASRNISGAGLAGVNVKSARLSSDETGIEVVGVQRATNLALFRNLLTAAAAQEAETATSVALDKIDRALGLSDPANSRSPATLIAKLTSALQAYSATPQNETAAQIALGAARDVVAALHDATQATQSTRADADRNVAGAIAEVNDLLAKFGGLNQEIVAGTATGADVSDALDKRDGLLVDISKKIGVTAVTRPNNDIVLYTDSGLTLFETHPRSVAFKPTPNLSPGVAGAAVFIDRVQATGAGAPLPLKTGAIAGSLRVRDELAPAFQDQLDEIARGLVDAFAETDESGAGGPPLPGLFTTQDATLIPPTRLTPGYAAKIVLNATVDPAQGGDLSKLRDGGVSGNAAYVYNPTKAPGFAARLIDLAKAPQLVRHFAPEAGLGATASLDAYAAASVGWVGAKRQQAQSATTYHDAVVTQTTQALSNATGVNLDEQMSLMLALENSYQASAKLLETVNTLFTSLVAALHA